ncbi:MAG: iron ABC transporter permease [Candidatus Hydrogenedentes bacterium]|nr:iron ABC transporter permease [Candidatus Hydrogenedentota bacterium]
MPAGFTTDEGIRVTRSQTDIYTRRAALLLVCAAVLVIAVLPVAILFLRAIVTDGQLNLDAFHTVLSSPRQWRLLGNSLMVAGGTACLATLIGAPAGYALAYARVPARRTLAALFAIPALLPPYVLATAWTTMLGTNGLFGAWLVAFLPMGQARPSPFSVPGVILVLAFTYYPLVAFATMIALGRFDGRLEEAALLAGQRARVFRSVVVPLTLPSVLTGALCVFVLALLNFSVPSLMQVDTYPVELYASSATYDYAAATAQSLPLLALCLMALCAWAMFLRPRNAWLTGARRERSLRVSSHMRTWAAAGCWGLALLSVFAPLASLFVRSLPLRTYLSVWETARDEFVTSLLVGVLSATLLAGLAFLQCTLLGGGRRAATLMFAELLPFAVTGPLLSLGSIALWNRDGFPGLVYDSMNIVVLVCVARYLFIAAGILAVGERRLNPRLHEAARVHGVSWWRGMFGVTLPLQAPFFVACWGLAFVFAVGELDATVLVCPPGKTTLAIRLFTLMHYGPDAYVAALSLITAIVILCASACAAWAYGRMGNAHAASH